LRRRNTVARPRVRTRQCVAQEQRPQ
jgi:hypothetical protein